MLYRFEVEGLGIYEAVERACHRNDKRRISKPDGSWLPRVGMKFQYAISFWTETGLRKYSESGLRAWHESVVNGRVIILKFKRTEITSLYEDEYQVIRLLKSQPQMCL